MDHSTEDALIAAIFDRPDSAYPGVEQLIERDFPMDRISILQRAGGAGDDFLGIAYGDEKERVQVCAEQGALWGSLAGLIAGMSGLLFVPGGGMLLLAGPVINAITGAAIGAGVMAGSALTTRLAIALQCLGIPQDRLAQLHQAIMDGKAVMLVHVDRLGAGQLERRLRWKGAQAVMRLARKT